jgi:hypothetical protein
MLRECAWVGTMTLLFYSTGTRLIMIEADEKSEPEVVFGLERVAKAPSVACDVPGGDGAAVAGGDPEGERVADEDGAGLPVLSPVARHGHPPRVGRFDGGADHVTGAADVGDEHEVEVAEAVDAETDAARPAARRPAPFSVSVYPICY